MAAPVTQSTEVAVEGEHAAGVGTQTTRRPRSSRHVPARRTTVSEPAERTRLDTAHRGPEQAVPRSPPLVRPPSSSQSLDRTWKKGGIRIQQQDERGVSQRKPAIVRGCESEIGYRHDTNARSALSHGIQTPVRALSVHDPDMPSPGLITRGAHRAAEQVTGVMSDDDHIHAHGAAPPAPRAQRHSGRAPPATEAEQPPDELPCHNRVPLERDARPWSATCRH